MSEAPPSASGKKKADPFADKPLLQEVLPKLRPFQREALEFATQGKIFARQWKNSGSTKSSDNKSQRTQKTPPPPRGRLLLADEMGLDKTIQTIALISHLMEV